jgi:hypothetical protein
MTPSSRILKLKTILIKTASSMNFQHPILHNKMGWLKERIGSSLNGQGQCFWAEAINTTCHAVNQLYLHRLLKKISYELLTGNKPNVSYFRVFGSKCYVLLKRPKSSKFVPKVYEGFILGYDSSSRAYRVFNKYSDCVETTCDAVFDESDGFQVEQYDLDDVDDEEAPCDALRGDGQGPNHANQMVTHSDNLHRSRHQTRIFFTHIRHGHHNIY